VTLAFGSYDESYPPEVLRGYTPPLVEGARRVGAGVGLEGGEVVVEPTGTPPDLGPGSNTPEGVEVVPVEATRVEPDGPAVVAEPVDQRPTFIVTAGTPGSYDPEVPAKDRPRNVTELREVARPAPDNLEPWLAGEYVLVGTTGKRAHWSGDDWHGDESPGYAPAGDLE